VHGGKTCKVVGDIHILWSPTQVVYMVRAQQGSDLSIAPDDQNSCITNITSKTSVICTNFLSLSEPWCDLTLYYPLPPHMAEPPSTPRHRYLTRDERL
jgi:hypothetical protein